MESNLVQNLINLKSLPQTWVVKDFKEVVSDNSGGNKKLAKSNFLKEGDIAVVDQGKNLIAGFYNDTSLAVKTQPPYVVFGDHTRAFKYVDFPFVMGADGTKVLQPKKENCETKYLYYFFLSINVPNTGYNRHFKYLKELKIPLPPLDQQKKIAAILDAADAYRQKTKTLIEKYDELTQSLFINMFGDPVRNPMGWEVNFLEQVTTKIGSGATPRGGKQAYKKEGISLIRSMNVYDNRFKYKNLAFIDEDQAAKLKNVIVEKGDVLFNITGASICRSSVVPNDVLPARVNQHVSILRPIKSIITSKFLSRFLISENVKTKLLGVGSGGGAVMEAITKEQLQSIEVIKPPLELQNEFSKRVQLIEAQKAQAQASLVKAEDLFNSLLQRAFKGELIN